MQKVLHFVDLSIHSEPLISLLVSLHNLIKHIHCGQCYDWCCVSAVTPNELLTAGTHNWSFAFRFPRGLPSSCQIGCGSVSYEASTVVDIPWRFNSTHRIPFAIVKCIKVNTSQLRVGSMLEWWRSMG